MLIPAAKRAVVLRLSPRMREQVREHAIMQERRQRPGTKRKGVMIAPLLGEWGEGNGIQIMSLPRVRSRTKELA